MKFMKISLDDLEILRKHRVQSRNYYVSSCIESFTCGAQLCIMGKPGKNEVEYGICKQELKISNRNFVSGYLGTVNGGS